MTKNSQENRYPNLSKISSSHFSKSKDEPEFIRITFRKTSDFVDGSLTNIGVNKEIGVSAIVGIIKGKKMQCAVSAFRFPKKNFSIEEAQKWVDSNFSVK